MSGTTLGLSMIVRNGGTTLRRCLESARPVVSEIVVADTGSSDDSVEIARNYGARCESVAWEQDFSAARNAALKLSTTDWVLSLDADEELDTDAGYEIARLLRRQDVGGYAVPVRNYLAARHGSVNGNRAKANDGRCASARQAPAFAEHLVVRLFRRDPRIFYRGCVHEAVAPQIIAAGMKLATAPFCIHHLGFLETDHYRDKAEFYLDLLRKKVEQEPENAHAWLELGRQLHEPFRQNEEALFCLERALAVEPNMPGASFLAAVVNLDLGRDQEAIKALDLAKGDDEYAAEREHCRGDALHNLGRLGEAHAAYARSLQLIGRDPQIESKLGYVEVRLGDRISGFLRLKNALAALPLGAELHERLIKAYMAAGMLAEAAVAAEAFASTVVHPRTVLRAAAIRAHLHQPEKALALISRGLEFFPQSAELQHARAELAGK